MATITPLLKTPPKKYRSPLRPWYQIVWRLLWIVPITLVTCVLFAMVFIGFGPQDAQRHWEGSRLF